MTIAQLLVKVEQIYEPILKSEQNEFSEYVIKNIFIIRGLKTY